MLREAPCCDPRHHWTKRAPSKAAKAAALLDLIRKVRNKMLATIKDDQCPPRAQKIEQRFLPIGKPHVKPDC